jgi:hypothetical protein
MPTHNDQQSEKLILAKDPRGIMSLVVSGAAKADNASVLGGKRRCCWMSPYTRGTMPSIPVPKPEATEIVRELLKAGARYLAQNCICRSTIAMWR